MQQGNSFDVDDKETATAAPTASKHALYTSWKQEQLPPGPLTAPNPLDYRDKLPPRLEEVAEFYRPVVQHGAWTHGLWECWHHKQRVVKSAVHIPCWEAYRWNCCKWRGCVCGRTGKECWWTGWHEGRFSRVAVGADLGAEYRMTLADKDWRHAELSLGTTNCAVNCALSAALSLGFSVGGTFCLNFLSFLTCNERNHLRQRYNLPPTFCRYGPCKGKADDCLVHTCCMYCASHQESREAAVRGIDGPGLHILDVLPQSFAHLPGWEEAVAERKALVDTMVLKRTASRGHGKPHTVPDVQGMSKV